MRPSCWTGCSASRAEAILRASPMMHFTPNRRLVLALVAGAGLPRLGWTQSFPSQPLKIVVPNAAGGAADLTARAVAQKLAEPLGQSVFIENKPSAGGIVAGELVARVKPDGHT